MSATRYTTQTTQRTSTQTTSTQTTNTTVSHYENNSDSIDFCFSLMTDPQAFLSQTDIMEIFTQLQHRNTELPFSINSTYLSDVQGLSLSRELQRKLQLDRLRVGSDPQRGWFRNIANSHERAKRTLDLVPNVHFTNTDFFQFNKYYSRIKLSMNHFQYRNLVCCGSSPSATGIYYPLNYVVDSPLAAHPFQQDHDYESIAPLEDTLHQYYRINKLSPDIMDTTPSVREPMKLDCVLDSHELAHGCNSRVSLLAFLDGLDALVCGTFDGSYVVLSASTQEVLAEHFIAGLTKSAINSVTAMSAQMLVASLDGYVRSVDLGKSSSHKPNIVNSTQLPIVVNCMVANKNNGSEILLTGNDTTAYILDMRQSGNGLKLALQLKGHEDYGHCCDWSPTNENLLVTGNQDGSVKLWDRRQTASSFHGWDSSLGRECVPRHNRSSTLLGGPVRNVKFSQRGEFLAWAETMDHVGIISTENIMQGDANVASRVQSIDFMGKYLGLSFSSTENGHGEELVLGVSDTPLGGILSYKVGSKGKSLDFEFYF